MTTVPPPLVTDRGSERRAAPRGDRPFEIWDLLGVLLVASGAVILLATGSQWGSESGFSPLAWLGLGLGAGVATSVVVSALIVSRRREIALSEVVGTLVRAWTNPARDWMLFVLGCLMFIPIGSLNSSVIPFDADSANLQSSIGFVQRHGLRHLVETQEVFLPHVLLGPLLLMGGTSAAMLFSIASVQALGGTISYLAWKLSRSALASVGAVIGLMAFQSVLRRGSLLTMYPTMLIFGFLGAYLAHRAIVSTARGRWMYAISSGFSLILSMEAHQVGQLFLIVPAFLVVTARFRIAAGGLWRVYAAAAVFYLPRAAVNLMEGGLSYFLLNRVDYWVTGGHLVKVQDFLLYPSRLDFFGYLDEFATLILEFMPSPLGLVVFATAALGFFLARGRQRWFAVLGFSFLTAVALYREVPPFARYFSPQIVGAALAAGLTIGLLWRRGSILFRSAAIVIIVVLLIGGWLNFAGTLRLQRTIVDGIIMGPLPSLAARIDDGRGVIGARAIHVAWVDPDIEVFGGLFLSEDEYVTFFTWPSDGAVMRVLERHDIGWVLVNPDRNLETDYHDAWIGPAYDLPVRHVAALRSSPNFCLVMEREGYLLYRLGACD